MPVKVNRQPDGAMRFAGEFEIKQTNYAMEPESIAGVVKVANEMCTGREQVHKDFI